MNYTTFERLKHSIDAYLFSSTPCSIYYQELRTEGRSFDILEKRNQENKTDWIA